MNSFLKFSSKRVRIKRVKHSNPLNGGPFNKLATGQRSAPGGAKSDLLVTQPS